MAVKDLNLVNDTGNLDESQEVLSLEELARRQQAAMGKLKEATSAFDNLLKETIVSVDESVAHWKEVTDGGKKQEESGIKLWISGLVVRMCER